jgi:hypothetical protein
MYISTGLYKESKMFAENDFMVDLQSGRIPGMSLVNAMGERTGMGTTVTGEDIWRGNELSVVPATVTSHTTIPTPSPLGEQMTLISEANADNGTTATGVLTMEIQYINVAGLLLTEVVTMNGLTPVDTVATDIIFIQDMHSKTVGANGVCEGHVRVYKKGDAGLVYNMIAAGGNKSLVPHRMVPRGKKLLLMGWHGGEVNSKNCVIRIRSTDMHGELLPGVFCFKGSAYVNKNTTGPVPLHALCPAFSIVKASAWIETSTGVASIDWWGVLRDDLIQ